MSYLSPIIVNPPTPQMGGFNIFLDFKVPHMGDSGGGFKNGGFSCGTAGTL
jgi:hypothetical protein